MKKVKSTVIACMFLLVVLGLTKPVFSEVTWSEEAQDYYDNWIAEVFLASGVPSAVVPNLVAEAEGNAIRIANETDMVVDLIDLRMGMAWVWWEMSQPGGQFPGRYPEWEDAWARLEELEALVGYTYDVFERMFPIEVVGFSFYVAFSSNSTTSNVAFNVTEKNLIFNVTGLDATIGFCNVTIPKGLLWGVYTIYVNGTEVDYIQTENPTHAFLYFTYNHTTHNVRIHGTEAIPVARFTYSPAIPSVREQITFNASPSFDLYENITSYRWDFDDGNISSTVDSTIVHSYIFPRIYNVTLTVIDSQGLNSTYSQKVSVKMPTSVSILTSSLSTFVGFKVNITGTLSDIYGNGLRNETVVLYYTFSEIGTWTPITSDTTDNLGNYHAVWIPPATGYFVIKTEWAGNSTYIGTYNVTNLNILSYADEYIFSVESNSTVSSLTFNTTNWTLSFTVSGPPGTKGYVKVIVAKSLVANITNVRVYLDGNQTEYSVISMDDSWLLTFTYIHSAHQIAVDLDPNIIPEFPTWISMLLIFILLTFALAITKRRPPKTTIH